MDAWIDAFPVRRFRNF